MNENITGRKDWYYEGVPGFSQSDGKITVILEDEGRRLVQVDFNGQRPMYYLQKAYINENTGEEHWIDVHYDRSKIKMLKRYKGI